MSESTSQLGSTQVQRPHSEVETCRDDSALPDSTLANSSPSPDEITCIRAAIALNQSKVDEIDKEVASLRQRIDQLLDRRQPIIERIDRHKGLIHPIHRLPTEILQEVFVECAPDDLPGSMHARDCPMVLLSVCQRWRQLALQTPWLWSTMFIPIPLPPRKEREIAQSLVIGIQQWISRSASVPLSFTIVRSGTWNRRPSNDPPYSPMDAIFPILAAQADRWEQLHLAISWESALAFIEQRISTLPQLKAVTLNMAGHETIDDIPHEIIAETLSQSTLLRATSLKHFALSAIPGVTRFLSMGLPVAWDKLTTLVIDTNQELPFPSAIFPILKMAGQLIELRLRISAAEADDPSLPAFETITLPNLSRLSVIEYMWFPAFGTTIRCPRLEHLEYYDTTPPNQAQHNAGLTRHGSLQSLLSHCGANLRSLTFDPWLYSTEVLVALLCQCGELESLVFARVYSRYSPSDVWGAVNTDLLNAFVGPSPLCPRLTSLACDHTAGFKPDDFLAYLRVKQDGERLGLTKLNRVVVNFRDTEIAGFTDHVQDLFTDKSRAVVKFTIQRGQGSLRNGGWERVLYTQWHSFSYRKYFGKEKYPLLTSC